MFQWGIEVHLLAVCARAENILFLARSIVGSMKNAPEYELRQTGSDKKDEANKLHEKNKNRNKRYRSYKYVFFLHINSQTHSLVWVGLNGIGRGVGQRSYGDRG